MMGLDHFRFSRVEWGVIQLVEQSKNGAIVGRYGCPMRVGFIANLLGGMDCDVDEFKRWLLMLNDDEWDRLKVLERIGGHVGE